MRIVVIGGGVIGALTARALVGDGRQITLVERGLLGAESSWAGGGIVSPLYPWRYSAPVTALASWAQRAYPALAETLKAETGIDPELATTGMLMLAPADRDQALAWASREGYRMEAVAPEQARALAPALAEQSGEALWMPDIANVRNPRLMQALASWLRPRIAVREQRPVVGLVTAGGKVSGVRLASGETLPADQVVVATGAWSGAWFQDLGVQAPVRPIKGEMLLYYQPELLNRIVLGDGAYVIPRRDGHLLVGSTLADVGFDKTPTREARDWLRQRAAALVPALAGLAPSAHWAGLRPGCPGGVPLIGPVPGYDGLWVNAGHYRNGLVLAPASAQLLADLLLQREPALDPAPYAWTAPRGELRINKG